MEPVAATATELNQAHLLWLGLPPLCVIKEQADRTWGTDPTNRIEQFCIENDWSRDLLDTVQREHGKTAVCSYREKSKGHFGLLKGGLQIVVHVIDGVRTLEVDGDLIPPQHERPIAIFGHMFEVLANKLRKKTTDQRRRSRYMAERGITVDPVQIAALLEKAIRA